MFTSFKHEVKNPKCFFTHCELPDYVDGHRPPTKKQPFMTINAHPCAHTVDLILPEELYEMVREKLESDVGTLRYARVYMSLVEVVSGDFFNQYIKAGNVLMLSQGRPGIDNLFSLREGNLRLELDKATYERCGLVGKVMPDLGRKHIKSRYEVELDLRQPSMLHGKKGFDRIVWGFKNALNHTCSWLFVDLDRAELTSGPIVKHHPQSYDVKPTITKIPHISIPIASSMDDISDPVCEEQLFEWLGMITLDSPRIRSNDDTDRYLCRFDLPEAFTANETRKAQSQGVVRLRWHGLATCKFIRTAWLIPKAVLGEFWFAMNVSTFGVASYTVLCSGGRDVLLWECR